MAKKVTDFVDIQSEHSRIIESNRFIDAKVDNLDKAYQNALREGNHLLANKIDKLLQEAKKEQETIKKNNDLMDEICQELAKLRGIKLKDKTKSELKDEDKELDNKVNKLNDFWRKFGYEFTKDGDKIKRSKFGEGFGSTKQIKSAGEAVSMFGRGVRQAGITITKFGGKTGKLGGQIGNFGKIISQAGGSISKFAGLIGLVIEILKKVGEALNAISDADVRQQDIQNQRNTMLTNRNIELSKIETEGNVDILNNFKDNMLSEYNKLFTQLQGQVAIANAKAIASTNATIEGTIGDINEAAWNALAAQTDIFAQSQKLGLQVAKTNDIENRAIAQRNIELQGRQSERGYQSNQEVLKAQKEDVELTIKDMNNAYQHPWAETANRIVGGSTEADHVRGDNKYNEQYGYGEREGIMGRGVTGSTIMGVLNPIIGSVTDNYYQAATKKMATVARRDLTNASNDLNAAQAENTNRVKVQNTVIANSNEIKNKVIEGVTDIKSSVIDTQVAIEKAYQKMAQAVEKWMMDFQDKAYDSGIGKGMTSRGQLDRYRSSMLTITEDVARKYGLTKDEVIKMQNDYTAEGRSKLLNGDDMRQQAAFGKIYLGGDFGTAAELSNNTEIFNMGVSDTVDLMGEMSKTINKMGLDGRKYLKDMVKNLKMAQKYDFKNGVKGMMKMAQWAQNTRFNMDNLPNMIEDIQKGGLEGIITKAAKLQVLGGRFAMGADPIAMAFEAYNDPAALAKRYNSMTMGMGHFNKKTGQVEFNGMEQDQMRALAEYSGQSLEDVRKQATYNVKKDRVEGFIKDKTLTEDQRMSLVNKAYYQDGQWKVNDVTGNAVNLSEVNSSNIKDIQADTYEGKMEQGMQEIVSFTKLFTGNTEANMANLSNTINKNGAADNELWKRLHEEQSDFFAKSEEYAATVLEKMQEATQAYKDFLNGFKDPADTEKEVLSSIKTFSDNTYNQLNAILKQMGGAADGMADRMELANKLKGLSFGVKTKEGQKNISAEELVNNGSLYMGGNGQLYINQDKVRATYGDTGKLMYGEYTRKQLKQRGINKETYGKLRYTGVNGTTDYAESVKRQNEQRAKWNEENATTSMTYTTSPGVPYTVTVHDKTKEKKPVKDGVLQSNNNPMFTEASKVTPINDGNVQIAKSDPKDTAVFAKTGGPFDTLFNDVFGRINDVYNKVSSDVLPTEPLGNDAIFAEPPVNTNESAPINDGNVQIDPFSVTINGKLELSNNGSGQTVDIMSEIKNNPILLRTISDMIVQNISSKYYGGRSVGNSNFRN